MIITIIFLVMSKIITMGDQPKAGAGAEVGEEEEEDHRWEIIVHRGNGRLNNRSSIGKERMMRRN